MKSDHGIAARFACALLLLAVAHAVRASETWPARPVRVIVPFVAGGGVDTVARITANRLGGELGQQVIVDNRTGARGVIGVDIVAKSAADGYTLLVVSESLTVMPFVERSLPFDVRKHFVAVSMLATQPLLLAVHPSLPAQSLKEFIALAKAKPAAISYGSGGFGQHLAGEVIKKSAGFEMTHVPYKGGAQAAIDLVGGQVNAAVLGSSPVIPFARSGKLRVLVVTSKARSAQFPNVPTLAEEGIATVDLAQWVYMLAPAKTPPERVSRLNAALVKAIGAAEPREKLQAAGYEVATGTPQQLDTMLHEALARWAKLIPELNIKPE